MSRLLEQSESIREQLEARNLYTPEDPYNLNGGRLVNTVNTIASIISPFNSFDLSNTVFGRIIGPNTPIAQIGLVMLGRQFAANVASNAAQEYLPSINFSNLFDGDPSTKLFTNKIDFQITRRATRTSLSEIANDLIGRTPPTSPFTKNPNVREYIEKTGKGVLNSLYENISHNVYKISDSNFVNSLQSREIELSSGSEILSLNNFIDQDSRFYPFHEYKSPLYDISNSDYLNSKRNYLNNLQNGALVLEYGYSQQFIDDLGITSINNNTDGAREYVIDSNEYGIDESPINNLVWGRDGVSQEYEESVGNLYEDRDDFDTINRFDSFDINNGLLNYTRQLLNSKGKYGSFDLTRKKFLDTNEQVHFNGSPLDTLPDGSEKNYNRRHSILDPYDKYAKAIRFNGNQMYNGNPNSVTYRSVIPKIHPILNGNNIDVKNMMFSLENLALQVNENGDLNDYFNTTLPNCEIGLNGGRLMWFPPYDIRLSEQSVARWENTQFIGRGEPIYTYNNSERIANLSFKLLVDYPPQLLNYKSQNDFHKKASEFFAFGGEGIPDNQLNIPRLEKQLQEKIEQKNSINETEELVDPSLPFSREIDFYFPNDIPKQGNTTGTGVEYVIGLGYENGVTTANDCGVDDGLNETFINNIDQLIIEFLSIEPNSVQRNEETYANINFVNIEIEGYATTLYETDPSLPASERRQTEQTYNQELSQRRINSIKTYINSRFKSLWKTSKDLTEFEGFAWRESALGATTSSPSNGTVDNICSGGAKRERRVSIRFIHNGQKISKTNPLTPTQIDNINKLNEDIDALTEKISNAKKIQSTISPCVFTEQEISDGYQKGFRSIHTNKFYPVFHSQTPEDFHKRLTFLQQCVRQGSSIRKQRDDGDLSAKNSVFGRPPICILRIGDFFHTKVVIDNISFQYEESTWDLNPEGMGMQPMIADITIQMKVIGGQSLKTPIEAIQNAASFNYYANSTFYNKGVYSTPTEVESLQVSINNGVDTETSNNAKKNNVNESINIQNRGE